MKKYMILILFFCMASLFSSCSYDENDFNLSNAISGNRIISIKSDKAVVMPGETVSFDILAANVAGSEVMWSLGNRTAVVTYGDSFDIAIPENISEIFGSDVASLFSSKGYVDVDVNVSFENQTGTKTLRIVNETVAASYDIKSLSINTVQLAAWEDLSAGTPIYDVEKGFEITLDKKNINIEVDTDIDSEEDVEYHWYVYSPASETYFTDSLFFNIYESGISAKTIAFTADADYYSVYLKVSRKLKSDIVDLPITAEDFYFFYIDFTNAE